MNNLLAAIDIDAAEVIKKLKAEIASAVPYTTLSESAAALGAIYFSVKAADTALCRLELARKTIKGGL